MSLSGPVRSGRQSLDDQRRFLLDSLLDLEVQREAGEISKADYEAMRDDYTVRAAGVLRALRELDKPAPAPSPRAPAPPPAPEATLRAVTPPSLARALDRPRRIVVTVVVAAMAGIALASVFLLANSGERGSRAAGPETVTERLALAHRLEGEGQAVEALKQYDAVLKEQPDHVEALAYRGWLLKLAGLVDLAQTALDRAVGIEPDYPDARFFRGMVLFRGKNEAAAAVPEFERYLALVPDGPQSEPVRKLLELARAGKVTPLPEPRPEGDPEP